jgi:hypothetical protein
MAIRRRPPDRPAPRHRAYEKAQLPEKKEKFGAHSPVAGVTRQPEPGFGMAELAFGPLATPQRLPGLGCRSQIRGGPANLGSGRAASVSDGGGLSETYPTVANPLRLLFTES